MNMISILKLWLRTLSFLLGPSRHIVDSVFPVSMLRAWHIRWYLFPGAHIYFLYGKICPGFQTTSLQGRFWDITWLYIGEYYILKVCIYVHLWVLLLYWKCMTISWYLFASFFLKAQTSRKRKKRQTIKKKEVEG